MALNTTFVAGTTVITAAHMNGIQSAWTSYTPTWTGASTNPVLNNGSFTGSGYQQYGKTIIFRIVLTMGTTTTYGTGGWRLTLPVTPLTSAARVPFQMELGDFGTGFYRGEACVNTTGPYLELFCDPTTAGTTLRSVATGVPHAWAVSDTVMITGTYEAA